MNVLVVAPHPDDEALGCGGTLCLHADKGDRAVAAFLTSGELGLKHLPPEEAWRTREAEAEAAGDVLGLAQLDFLRCPDWYVSDNIEEAATRLRPIIEREAPDVIYLPHAEEWHPDHKAALPVVQAAIRDTGMRPALLAYEVWTPLHEYDRVEDISAVVERKLQAVRCYASQLNGFRYDRAAHGLAQYRGALAGRCMYAEVFWSSYELRELAQDS
jgi:LmbE family N-acetylglucosaminyl deacetylase